MGLEGLNPADIAALDQERADIRRVLSGAVETVAEYLAQDGIDPEETFIALIREFARVDAVRLLAMFTEAVMQLADRRNRGL